jgi:hypothetical protein
LLVAEQDGSFVEESGCVSLTVPQVGAHEVVAIDLEIEDLLIED